MKTWTLFIPLAASALLATQAAAQSTEELRREAEARQVEFRAHQAEARASA